MSRFQTFMFLMFFITSTKITAAPVCLEDVKIDENSSTSDDDKTIEALLKSVTEEIDGDWLDLLDTYLKENEYLFTKEEFSEKTRNCFRRDCFTYPNHILSADAYQKILQLAHYLHKDAIKMSKTNKSPIQRITLPVDNFVSIFGDLHGNIHALARTLITMMEYGILTHDLRLAPKHYLFFLGDMVDYGRYGADTLALVILLKAINPDNVFISRGNHEDRVMTSQERYGFLQELQSRYGFSDGYKLYEMAHDFMESLPLAIYARIEGQPLHVQFAHGGMEHVPAIKEATKALLQSETTSFAWVDAPKLLGVEEVHRCGTMWNDVTGNPSKKSEIREGRGFIHNHEALKEYMDEMGIFAIMRGHQDYDYSFKNLIPGIDDIISLDSLSIYDRAQFKKIKRRRPAQSTEFLRRFVVKSQQTWDRILDGDYQYQELWTNGLNLGDLPSGIFPVFTFSNASGIRCYDEGFGFLTIGKSWQTSHLRAYIHRPALFADQVIKVEKGNLSKGDEAILERSFLSPIKTHIDENGKVHLFWEKYPTRTVSRNLSEFYDSHVKLGHPNGINSKLKRKIRDSVCMKTIPVEEESEEDSTGVYPATGFAAGEAASATSVDPQMGDFEEEVTGWQALIQVSLWALFRFAGAH